MRPRILATVVVLSAALHAQQQPTVRLEAADGKTHFLMGEPITLNLVFQNTTGQPFTINSTVYGDLSEKVEITPNTGWVQWRGPSGHDYASVTELKETEMRIPVRLDEGIVFRKAGHYEIRVNTRRLTSGMPLRGGTSLPAVTTNAVGIDIEAMPEDAEAAKVASLLAEYHSAPHTRAGQAARLNAVRQIAALQGDAALRAKVDLMLRESSAMRQVTQQALASTSNLKLQLELLQAAWADPAVKPIYDMPMALSLTRAFMRDQQLPGWTMVAMPDNSETAKTAAREHNEDMMVLVRTFPQRAGKSRSDAAYYILLDRSLTAEQRAPVMAALIDEFPHMNDLEQHMVLEVAKPPFRDARIVPALERLLAKDAADKDALSALITIDPARAKPYVVKAVCNEKNVPLLTDIGTLPDKTLPDVDACLPSLFTSPYSGRANFGDFVFKQRASLAARYATSKLLNDLAAASFTPQQQEALFPLRVRYAPEQAAIELEKYASSNLYELNKVYESLGDSFPPAVQKVFRERLEHGDDGAAGNAAYELRIGGDASDRQRILARLSQLRQTARQPLSQPQEMLEEELMTSLANSKHWSTPHEQMVRLGDGCLSDRCRLYAK